MKEIIDFRSDTVTNPTPEMIQAMCTAEAGDDVYGDDPTVKILERNSAEALGKEDAVFVPSGTFGNQLALLSHTSRGQEVILPPDNHIILHEVGASAVIAGVQLRFVEAANGKINMNDLELLYREEDIHHPETGLICMENAHSSGCAVPLSNMAQVAHFAASRKVPVHLDGARIFNAAAALETDAKEIASFFDSVMFCFSKGLCAPIGSILAGNGEFIRKARKNRKLMGGGMRQVGYIAAPCIIALEQMTSRLKEDHENARYLAALLDATGLFDVMMDRLDINMVFFKIKEESMEKMSFNETDFCAFLSRNNIKINGSYLKEFRLVTHYYINREKIDILIDLIEKYFKGGQK